MGRESSNIYSVVESIQGGAFSKELRRRFGSKIWDYFAGDWCDNVGLEWRSWESAQESEKTKRVGDELFDAGDEFSENVEDDWSREKVQSVPMDWRTYC